MDTLDSVEQQSKLQPYAGKSLQWGIVGGLGNIILLVLLYLLGLQFEFGINFLGILIMLVCALYCVKNVRDDHPYKFLGFGRAFMTALLCTLIISMISLGFFWIYVNYIDTTYYDQLMVVTREKMLKQGLTEEQVTATLKAQAKFMTPAMSMTFAFIGNIVISLIISLISAAVFKRNPK